jgi:hypothetical protein
VPPCDGILGLGRGKSSRDLGRRNPLQIRLEFAILMVAGCRKTDSSGTGRVTQPGDADAYHR